MHWDIETLKFLWTILVTLISGAAIVIAWWGNKQRANKEALTRVETKLEDRLGKAEHSISQGLDRVEANLDAKVGAVEKLLGTTEKSFRQLMDDHARRVTVAEEALRFAPKSEDIQRLHDVISNLAQNLARFEGGQKSLERTVERINQYLMEHGK